MLLWAYQSSISLFLDSNNFKHTYGKYECLVACDAIKTFSSSNHIISSLKTYHSIRKDWLFGHIQYEYKDALERLSSLHIPKFNFTDIHFFQPEIVCYILREGNKLFIESATLDPDIIWQRINEIVIPQTIETKPIKLKKHRTKDAYCQIVEQLKQHIIEGDCYEINFCNEAYAENVSINPFQTFKKLNAISPSPFASFYKFNNQYLLCASPERYLYKEGNKILSQPIKGTKPRGVDFQQDELNKISLQTSIKERAENLMIVDLIRNDLARVCKLGSIQVSELLKVYSFSQVHQMISTIEGYIEDENTIFDVINTTFPMGSMTGAPKIIVMKLIEQYELSRRELFSGSVGYIDPNGNADFNVIIRSLLYNAESKYLSYQTGGAITFESDAEEEWNETCIKASAIEKVLSGG